MSKIAKVLERVLRGSSDASIGFAELCALLRSLGFAERIRGSHHIFTRDGIAEILNLQPRGGQAKPYQVKQVRGVILAYGLAVASQPDATNREDDSVGDREDGTGNENDA
ncbi:MAG: type II toxin-antitoxin system HicA family toxin [Gemmataceae bacterium]